MTDMTDGIPPTSREGFGVDVGGSGVKGGLVDLTSGRVIGPRLEAPTPSPATPDAVAAAIAELVSEAGWEGDVGVTLPSVIKNQVARTAANIAPEWVGTDTAELFTRALPGRRTTVLNDADAAGIAEDRFGAARDVPGSVLVLTFGTGIGSALISDGVLFPNTELGHMEIDGRECEHRAAASVRTREGLSFEDWAERVAAVIDRFEVLFWPDLIVVGGGISEEHHRWVPLLRTRARVVPALLRNDAGIAGAAYAASRGIRP